MFRPTKVAILVVTSLVIAASFSLFTAPEAPGQLRGTGNRATLFVKGQYAYVADYSITRTLGDSSWVRIYDIEDPDNVLLFTLPWRYVCSWPTTLCTSLVSEGTSTNMMSAIPAIRIG